MKMGVDRNKFASHIKKGLICFGKACCRSVREYPFIVGIVVFFVLLYAFLPVLFFFLISNSPVIVCTAVLLGTLLSFGQPHIPEIIEEREETAQEISSLKVVGGSDHVVIENDGNSETRIPLLTMERHATETIEEEDIKGRSLGDDRGKIIDGTDSPSSEDEQDEEEQEGGEQEEGEEKETRSTLVFSVESQEDVKIMPRDDTYEAELSFTPRDTSTKEEMQLARPHLDREIRMNKTLEALKFGENEDSGSKSKFYCRSNSRRTVRFAMHDVEKVKDEKKIEEEGAEESKHTDEEFVDQEKIPDAHVEDSFSSTFGSSWLRIDQLSRINHDDQFSHSSSEHAESSSSDASMADIIPLLDELNPLLDSETPQPTSVEPSDGKSEESENHYSGEDDDDDDDGDDDYDDDSVEVGKEGAKVREGEHEGHKEMKGVTWTEDDTKNVMDLGSSELERNQRLEDLMAKRRARRNQKMELKDLIDLQSDDRISLSDDDSSFNAVLESVPLHASPFLFRSATLPIKRNPFDLPCDAEEEITELSVPSSARAPSNLSTRRNPFDLLCDHAGMDNLLVGEASSHGEFMTVHHKGLYNDEIDLLGRPHFEGVDHEKRDVDMISVYNMAAINAVTGSDVISSVHLNNVELLKPQTSNDESTSLMSSFHGHFPKAVEENIQKADMDNDRFREGISSNVKKGTADSHISSSQQSGLVSSVEEQEGREILGAINESGSIYAEASASVEPADSEPSYAETDSESSDEAQNAEVRDAQINCEVELVHVTKSISSELTDEHIPELETFDHHIGSTSHVSGLDGGSGEHPTKESCMPSMGVHMNLNMEYATEGSPEVVVFPLGESPSKRHVGSDIVEKKFDDSSSSTSSEVEETKFNASTGTGQSLLTASEITHSEPKEPDILKLDSDESRIGEPVFDSSPSAFEKFRSGFSSMSEAGLLVEKGDLEFPLTADNASAETSELRAPGMMVDKSIIHEYGEGSADGEGKAVDAPSVKVLVTEDLMPYSADLSARDDENPSSGSSQSHHGEETVELKEVLVMPASSGQNIRTIQVEPASVVLENAGTEFVHVADSSELVSHLLRDDHLIVNDARQHGDDIRTFQTEVIDGGESSPRSPINYEVSVHVGPRPSDAEVRIDGGLDQSDESAPHLSSISDHVSSEAGCSEATPSTLDDGISEIAQGTSKEYVGADHDVWVMKEEEVECIQDLDEDLLCELDAIGDFRVVEETPLVHSTEKQLQAHVGDDSREDARTDSLIHMAVVDAQSVEDISLALKHFCDGESSKSGDRQLIGREKNVMKYEGVSAYDNMEARRHDQSELAVVEARSLDDIHLVLKQFSGGDSQIHNHGVVEARENQEKKEFEAEKAEHESVETDVAQAIVKVGSFEERESCGDTKEENHHGSELKQEEENNELDDSNSVTKKAKDKKSKHKRSSSSSSSSSSSYSD